MNERSRESDSKSDKLETKKEKLKFLIVDDHCLVRNGLKAVMTKAIAPRVAEFFEVDTFCGALDYTSDPNHGIDIVFLDVSLPDVTLEEEIFCVKERWNKIRVVIISACDDCTTVMTFFRAGVSGYISKSSSVEIITSAINLVLAGGRYFPDHIISSLLSNDLFTAKNLSAEENFSTNLLASAALTIRLSSRQLEVRKLMLAGMTNKEIAKELGLAVGTVKNYVAQILQASKSPSRAKAIACALKVLPHDENELPLVS